MQIVLRVGLKPRPLLPDSDNAGVGRKKIRYTCVYRFHCVLIHTERMFFMSNQKTRCMVECAVMVALAVVLSYIRVYKLPWGGSITLLSMLPIAVFSIRRGIGWGLGCSFLFSLFQFAQGVGDGLFTWGLTPVMLSACIFLDYIGAYTVLGIAGVFRDKGNAGNIAGTVLAIMMRFLFHFLSGVVIWQSYGELWNGFSTESSVVYSLLYNGSYMLPELIFTTIGAAVLFGVPQTKKLLTVTA